MRYTEQDNSFKFEGFYDYVRGTVVLVMIAPLRLIKELSTKIVFLPRETVKRLLLYANIMSVAFLVLQTVINLAFLSNEFSLVMGKVPVVVQLVAQIILILLYFWYTTYDFIVYQQLDKFLPIVTGVNISDITSETNSSSEDTSISDNMSNASDNLQFDNFEDLNDIIGEQIKTTQSDTTMDLADVDNLLSDIDADFLSNISVQGEQSLDHFNSIPEDQRNLINEDIINNEDIFQFQNELDIAVDNLEEVNIDYKGNMVQEELDTVNEKISKSRDPSKYISEDNLQLFFSKIGVDNFGIIDDLSNWSVPKDFQLVT